MLKPSLVAALALLSASGDAFAQETPDPEPVRLDAALDEAALAAESIGAAAFGLSLQTLTATNTGNSVSAERVETGDIVIDAGALNGFNGIGNFVMNTGNNNNLQGAVSVVVVMTPP